MAARVQNVVDHKLAIISFQQTGILSSVKNKINTLKYRNSAVKKINVVTAIVIRAPVAVKNMNKPIRIYNHIYQDKDDTWIFILLDQMYEFERSGLYENCESITIVFIGKQHKYKLLLDSIKPFQKVKVLCHTLIPEKEQNEIITLEEVHRDSMQSDHYILYTHCKGVTAWSKYFQNNPSFFTNYYLWRKYLEWGCIEKWRECINLLDTNDVAGCNYNEGPLPHFSGTMWWSKSSYIRTLDNVYGEQQNQKLKEYQGNRFYAEFWPCSKTDKIGSIHNPPEYLRWPNQGIYSVPWTRGMYSRET